MTGDGGALVLVLSDGRRLAVLSSGMDYEYETFYTDHPAQVPDLHWLLAPGPEHKCLHVHRWQTDAEHDDSGPRLVWFAERRIEHVDCDGSCGLDLDCDGWSVTRWWCPATGTYIEPGTMTGPSSATYRTFETVTLQIDVTGITMDATPIIGARIEQHGEVDSKPVKTYTPMPTLRPGETTYIGDSRGGSVVMTYSGGPIPRD